jgi:hypothetical protein
LASKSTCEILTKKEGMWCCGKAYYWLD